MRARYDGKAISGIINQIVCSLILVRCTRKVLIVVAVLDLMKDVFFLVGALEDAHLAERKHCGDYTIEIDQKNEAWLKVVALKLFRVFHKKPTIRLRSGNRYYRLRLHSKKILLETKQLRSYVYDHLLNADREAQSCFLRGIYDAEGSVHKKRQSIVVSNKKARIIRLCQLLLEEVGITTGRVYIDRVTGVRSLPMYGKNNLRLFNKYIGFSHPNKKERLRFLIDP